MRITLKGAQAIRARMEKDETLDRLWGEARAATDALVAQIEAGGGMTGPLYDDWQTKAAAFRERAEDLMSAGAVFFSEGP